MLANKKYIIPLAIVKIALVYLILQLFFTSCSDEDILYDRSFYSEGPLVEIHATFGNDLDAYNLMDTVTFDISIDSPVFEDKLTYNEVVLNNALYNIKFYILNEAGEAVNPLMILEKGSLVNSDDGYYMGEFGTIDDGELLSKSNTTYSKAYLRAGFVFDTPGRYTLYFENTPNGLNSNGDVDIYYDENASDSTDVKVAYAFFLFDLDSEKSMNYDNVKDSEEDYMLKNEILTTAGWDQAIKDFTIIE